MNLRKIVFFLSFLTAPLFSHEWDEGVFDEEAIASPVYPFSVSGDAIYVSSAKFHSPSSVEDEGLLYVQNDVAFAYTSACNTICGLIFGAGYINTEVNWKQNPDFHQKYFNYVNLSAGVYSNAFPDWFWSLVGNMLIDTEVLSLSEYTLYQIVLQGKYSCWEGLSLTGGFILELGLSKEKIWPIIGFVVAPCPDQWKLSFVYPIDISFDYFFSKIWSAGASIRFLRNRHRVKETEPLPQGIFEYRSTGGEFDLTFAPFRQFSVSGFAGYDFGGDLKITNSNNKDATHYKFDGSFYAGISALLSY